MSQYDGELLSSLSLLNPWWDLSEGLSTRPGEIRRRPFSEVCAHLLAANDSRAALLTGPRRVGKTTLAKQVLVQLHGEPPAVPRRNLIYVDFQERLFGDPGPEDVLRTVLPRTQADAPVIVVFDEIQFLTEWDKALRGVIQRSDPRRVRILATGSGTAELRRTSGDTLLDRVHPFHLGSMVFSEYLELVGRSPDRPRAEIEASFLSFAERGGFPEIVQLASSSDVRRRLRMLCERYVLDGDVVRRLKIRQSETLARLWLHLVRHPGELLNPSQIGNETGTKRDTVEGWISALRQAELIVAVDPSDAAGWPMFGKNRFPRAYPSDHGLCVAYGLDALKGPTLETLVLRHLRDFCDQRELDHKERPFVTTWRDDRVEGPAEIDFRVRSEDVSLLIEVTGARHPTSNKLSRLASVASRLKQSDAILVHCGDARELHLKSKVKVHVWPIIEFVLALRQDPSAPMEVLHDGSHPKAG